MKLLISGLCGHMGTEVAKLALAGCRGADPTATVGVDMNACGAEGIPCAVGFETATDPVFTTADCIVDFSHHSATPALLDYAVANNIPVVLATTGHTEEEKAAITKAAASIPVFFAANFSLGVALLIDTARQVAAAMPEAEIEIIEKHHNRKLDAPSGTALLLAQSIQKISDWRNKYPAFAWCADHGDGWYLPAIKELELLLLNDEVHDAVNNQIARKGKAKLFSKGEFKTYWSSTEQREWWAWFVNMRDGGTFSDNRSLGTYVRAVSTF